ncbi:MAG TPA: histidine kinase dimerization/phospho-acceptor domain-containing protein [Bryobacteraceae bacterium]|nr:histidine kinase dimerization/phospho-acceptor domain-containing protein [Bryobacteraceae bacterium]
MDLSQFAYVASHDLRSPLNTVLSFAQILDRRHGEQLGKEGKEFIGFVTTAAKRMAQLIEDLLQYAKVSSDTIEVDSSVDANTMIDAARRFISPPPSRASGGCSHARTTGSASSPSIRSRSPIRLTDYTVQNFLEAVSVLLSVRR